jgi:hypothetical protein
MTDVRKAQACYMTQLNNQARTMCLYSDCNDCPYHVTTPYIFTAYAQGYHDAFNQREREEPKDEDEDEDEEFGETE